MRYIFTIATIFSLVCVLQAQDSRRITGKVFSAQDSIPLPGANIVVKGTKKGAITDFDGRFIYQLVADNINETELVISYLGFQSKTLKIGTKNTFAIYLEPDNDELGEVIITSSYGTNKLREEVVGSISQLSNEDINTTQSFESVDKMIEGLAPGVQVISNTQLGTATQINIRGQGTFTPLTGSLLSASSQPLIIVDGVILSEESGFDDAIFDGGTRFGEEFLNPLTKIPPEEIESISILKDAAAVSVYGADGANGVILITTKKGKAKKFEVNISQQAGFSNPINQIKFLSGPQYHSVLTQYYVNNGETLANATSLAGSSTINTDWFDIMNETGAFSRTRLNVSGGKGNFGFRSSLSYLLNDEVQVGNKFNNLSGTFGVSYNQNKFSADFRLVPSLVNKSTPNSLFSFPLPPNLSPFQEDGSFSVIETGVLGNPLAVLQQNLSEARTVGLLASLNLSYQINDNWSLKTIVGYDFTEKDQDNFFSGANASGRLSGFFEADGVTYPNWGRKLNFSRSNNRLTFNQIISYQKKFDENHSLDGILGFEAAEEKISNTRILGSGFIEQTRNASFEDANDVTTNSFTSENARTSIFSQLNYDFQKKYFITGSLRQDQSSAFGGDVNAAINGALGASWVISREKFFEDINTIDFLRIRTSYGSSGNSRIGSFRARGLYNLDIGLLDNYNGNITAFPQSAPNPRLSWEKNTKFNTGLDLNFWKRRINFTVEYYRDLITDIISSTNIIPESGFTTVQANTGSMVNQGVEIALKAELIKKENLKYTFNFVFSRNQNEVLSVENLSSEFSSAERASALRVGESTTAIWGVNFIGIDPATGRELFTNNGQVYDGATYRILFDNQDWEVIGDRLPQFFGSFQHSFVIHKRWSVRARFLYTRGEDTVLPRNLESTDQLLPTRNMIVNVLDYWQQPGDVARNPRPGAGQPIIPNSTRYLYDVSHIKFQNLSINYNVNQKIVDKLKLKSAAIFVNIDNIGYWYKSGSPSGQNGIRELRFNYPEMRTMTIGANISI